MRTDQTFTTGSEEAVLAVSLELAAATWKVALHDGRREKPAVHTVAEPQAAARLQAVLDLIEHLHFDEIVPYEIVPSLPDAVAAQHMERIRSCARQHFNSG